MMNNNYFEKYIIIHKKKILFKYFYQLNYIIHFICLLIIYANLVNFLHLIN